MTRKLKGNDATPVVCDMVFSLLYDGSYENFIICPYCVRYLLCICGLQVPYDGTWTVCTTILRLELAQLLLTSRIDNLS